MNITKRFILAAVALTLSLSPLTSRAADYAVQKTFWAFTGSWTSSPTVVTNLAAAIDVTQVADFGLSFVGFATNNTGAGSFDVNWDTSLDGSNFSNPTNAAIGVSSGWFSIPATNTGVATIWNTNITVNSIGYWRIRSITNNSGVNWTNIQIRGYVKPKRTNRDY